MGGLVFWILALVVTVIVIAGLRNKLTNSSSVVVTGKGVLKTHNVEAKFRSDTGYHGKLGQDRWSDGQERFSLRLSKLGSDHDGKLQLFRNGEQVSEFDVSGSAIDFAWKGMSSEAIPLFAIGDQLRVDVGSLSITATVEAD